MLAFLSHSFAGNFFIPHGHCYLWQPELVWLHVISDALIALAYTLIPICLIYFVQKRKDIPFDWILVCFGSFIVFCGLTHVMGIWTVWNPNYWLSGFIKASTAAVSLGTAGILYTLLPNLLAIPSPEQLKIANLALESEVQERQRAEASLRQLTLELEKRVEARTSELASTNHRLQQEIQEREQTEETLRQKLKREQLVGAMQERIRSSLNLKAVLNTTVEQVRHFLQTDRAVIYQFCPDWSGDVVVESVGEEWLQILNANIHDPCFGEKVINSYRAGRISVIEDTETANLKQCFLDLLKSYQVRADVVVPILLQSSDETTPKTSPTAPAETEILWGLLIIHHCRGPRQWEISEIDALKQLSIQIAIAIKQCTLFEQAQKAKDVADAANRAKSKFLANMSHELRTPLNAILGFTQVMSRDRGLPIEHQQQLGIINRAGEHLLELINDILDMSKIEAGRITLNETNFDLIYLLNTLEEMLRLKAQSKGLQLQFNYASDVPQYIRTDEGKLRQVLINLLGNAIKFTEAGSVTLSITVAKNLAKNPAPKISLKSQPQWLNFTVQDTGPGIAKEDINLIFEAFGQTETGRQSQQGTGLGLPISRSFVKLMGGDIMVNSVLGQGTTFTFQIQAEVANAEAVKATQPQSKKILGLAANQPQYRILAVDDRPEGRLLLIKILTALGFDVKEAGNGQEAVDVWESWEPHLILMDMRMPVMDGYQATQRIKSHIKGQATVIIALTASAFEEERVMLLSAGCDDFLRKPFQKDVLLETIGKYLGLSYIYETEQNSSKTHPSAASGTEHDIHWHLKQMSPEWMKQIYQAASQGSDDIILGLLEKIPPENTSLAEMLATLANNFQFEKIMEFTQTGKL